MVLFDGMPDGHRRPQDRVERSDRGPPRFSRRFGYALDLHCQWLALGFVSYTLIRLAAGRGREVSVLVYLLGLVFLAYFIFL